MSALHVQLEARDAVLVCALQFGLKPEKQAMNFVSYKEVDESYKLVVLFAEADPTAGTIRQ